MGGRGPGAGRNRNQSCRPAGPSLLTSEPEDVFLVSCHLPEEQGWNWLLEGRVQRPAGRFSPRGLSGDMPRVWAVLVQSCGHAHPQRFDFSPLTQNQNASKSQAFGS